MTIEKLAEMSQREFTAIRGEMREGFLGVHEDTGILRRDMESGFQSITEVLKLMREDLKEIKLDVTTIHLDYTELRARVDRLEKKIGI